MTERREGREGKAEAEKQFCSLAWPDMLLKDVIAVLNKLENDGVISSYAIGGAIAATFYLEPIATMDVDVFITLEPEPGAFLISLKPIFDWVLTHGGEMQGEYIMIAGWPVQFLPPITPLVEEALQEAHIINVDGESARVFSAEHLAAIALETGRPKDKTRLLDFINSATIDMIKFHEILLRFNLVGAWHTFQKQFGEGSS